MNAFSVPDETIKWHYLTKKNLDKFCSKYPFHQSSEYFALCPYCHNPIQIISRATVVGKSSLYGRHLEKNVKGLPLINRKRLECCIIRSKTPLFADELNATITFDVRNINHNNVRKALSFLLGVYITQKHTDYLLSRYFNNLKMRNVDEFNFPFALLLRSADIEITGLKVNNYYLQNIIDEQSKFFTTSESKRILQRSNGHHVILHFSGQRLNKAGIPVIGVTVKEEAEDIGHYNITCRMFNGLLNELQAEPNNE